METERLIHMENIQPVDVEQVLAARDWRQQQQKQLLDTYQRPIICFTMNIAGPVKRRALIEYVFMLGLEQLKAVLGKPLYEKLDVQDTGCTAYLVYDQEAAALKQACVELETAQPVGRLYDLDVITVDGRKLYREVPRTCLVCGQPAAVCARSRAHGLAEIEARTQDLLAGYAAQHLAEQAVSALLEEARLTPKPGLVDANNSGAHHDMSLDLLERSAQQLQADFVRFVRLGIDSPPHMPQLQQAGREAEQHMLEFTGGINTHKGAIYLLGLLLASMGNRLMRGGDIFAQAAALAQAGETARDTHGQEMLRKYGMPGARQEAEAGLPLVRAAYQQIAAGKDDLCSILLSIISQCSDTNVLYRGGPEALQFVQQRTASILNKPLFTRKALIQRLDKAMIERDLSPGGSADILAAALFLYKSRLAWLDADNPAE